MYRTRSGTWEFHVLTENVQHGAKVLFLEILLQSRKGELEQKTKVRLPFVFLFYFSSKKCSTENHIFSSVAT